MNDMNRPSSHAVYMQVAKTIAMRATCARRRVGCVLVNDKNQVLSTGYNGVAYGTEHCINSPCPAATAKSGTKLDECKAIHAEQNALLQCSDVSKINITYVTTSPCMHCIKLLSNTGCSMIVVDEKYRNFDEVEEFWVSTREDRSILTLPECEKIEYVNNSLSEE